MKAFLVKSWLQLTFLVLVIAAGSYALWSLGNMQTRLDAANATYKQIGTDADVETKSIGNLEREFGRIKDKLKL